MAGYLNLEVKDGRYKITTFFTDFFKLLKTTKTKFTASVAVWTAYIWAFVKSPFTDILAPKPTLTPTLTPTPPPTSPLSLIKTLAPYSGQASQSPFSTKYSKATEFVNTTTDYTSVSTKHTMVYSTGTKINIKRTGVFSGLYSDAKDFFKRFYQYIIFAPYMYIYNLAFPMLNQTVCDITVSYPSKTERAFVFFLKAIYVYDKDMLEEAPAIITCTEIPTDKRGRYVIGTVNRLRMNRNGSNSLGGPFTFAGILQIIFRQFVTT